MALWTWTRLGSDARDTEADFRNMYICVFKKVAKVWPLLLLKHISSINNNTAWKLSQIFIGILVTKSKVAISSVAHKV